MNTKVKTAKEKVLEIKKQREVKQSKLFKEIKLFWAFSNEQFEEWMKKNGLNKTIKLVHIGGGGYLPKDNYKLFTEWMDKMEKEYKEEMKTYKEELIKYELNNYECCYTWNIDDVVSLLKGFATQKQILKVFNSINYNNI